MGHGRARPIKGETAAGVGAHYIVTDRYADKTHIQVDAIGTVTFTVDWTADNITMDTASLAAINMQPNAERVDPGSAQWTNWIASGSADADAAEIHPIFGVRINITAGTGSVGYTILQAT